MPSWQARPYTILDGAAWLGRAVGTGLNRIAHLIYDHRQVRQTGEASTHAPIRPVGLFLVGFQAVALLALIFHRRRANAPSSLDLLLSPFTLGLALAGLWSFPTIWNRFPFLLRKALLVVLLLLLPSAFVMITAMPAFWKLVAIFHLSQAKHGSLLFVGMCVVWLISMLVVLTSKRSNVPATVGSAGRSRDEKHTERWANIPSITFADVGGMELAKDRIRGVVQNRLYPERYYGVAQNGILLHGPRGTGKTYLAEATAGEFRLNYYYVQPTELIEKWMGNSEANVRNVFARAATHRPILLFIDELDSVGASRQQIGNDGDPGGAGRAYNTLTIQLMQCIDAYRNTAGLVIMAATNFLDALDPAVVREGRFDVKIRVDLPDAAVVEKILAAQLAKRPHRPFDLPPIAKRLPGASAAKLKALVDRATALAAEQRRKIDAGDLHRAIEESGGSDRPLVEAVEWSDVVLNDTIERELRTLIRLLNEKRSSDFGVEAPAGLLLVGSPGTGKTMLARLVATQTRRSFYPISPADVLGGEVGGSVKRMQQIFARAREQAPSILFLDEIDGLLPRNNGQLSSHDVQLVEQTLMEISRLTPQHDVFLIGTTNHIDQIDPRVLRGGRFSEKIEVGCPDEAGYRKLLARYLGSATLAAGVRLEHLIEEYRGVSPADLEAICKAAKRYALSRLPENGTELPPLEWADFERARKRVELHF